MLDIIQKECLLLDVQCRCKEDVIDQLVQRLYIQNLIHDKEHFHQVIMEREALFPTAIGKLIAIPHGISEYVIEPSLCIARLRNPILWDKEKNEYASFVILIAVPIKNENNIHIQIISHLMRHLIHEEYIEKLLSASEDELLNILKEGLNELW